MNRHGYLYLGLLVAVGILSFALPSELALAPMPLVWVLGLGYFIYYIIHKDLHHGIAKALLLAFAVLALAVIPVLGWIILIGFVLYNLKRTLDSIKSLWPEVKVSLVFYGVFLARSVFELNDVISMAVLAAIYLAAAVALSRKLQLLAPKDALLKLSLMWLALPFMLLLIISIVSALSNLFKTVTSSVTRTIFTPQTVSAHVRSGVEVASYTRHVASQVTEVTARAVPNAAVISAGVVSSGVTAEVAQAAQQNTQANPQALPRP